MSGARDRSQRTSVSYGGSRPDGDEAVLVSGWDGSRAAECNANGCTAEPVIHYEATAPGREFVAEFDVCEEHLGFVATLSRQFLVAMGEIEPRDEIERNVRTAAEEHVDGLEAPKFGPSQENQEELYEIILSEFADLPDDEVVDLQRVAPRLLLGRTTITMSELRRAIRVLRSPKPGPPQPPMRKSRRHA